MPSHRSAKIYASQLPKGRHGELRQISGIMPAIVDGVALHDALVESVVDRIHFAEKFIETAKAMQLLISVSPFHENSRNALSRAYYAIHHISRAIVLSIAHYDPYGHPQSIKALLDCAADKPVLLAELRTRFTSESLAYRVFSSILEARHHADYDVYGASLPRETSVDFVVVAPDAIANAELLMESAKAYLLSEGIVV
jgi:uncharacterized protein (UPF0332 family)